VRILPSPSRGIQNIFLRCKGWQARTTTQTESEKKKCCDVQHLQLVRQSRRNE
jgi:hypothetical protein